MSIQSAALRQGCCSCCDDCWMDWATACEDLKYVRNSDQVIYYSESALDLSICRSTSSRVNNDGPCLTTSQSIKFKTQESVLSAVRNFDFNKMPSLWVSKEVKMSFSCLIQLSRSWTLGACSSLVSIAWLCDWRHSQRRARVGVISCFWLWLSFALSCFTLFCSSKSDWSASTWVGSLVAGGQRACHQRSCLKLNSSSSSHVRHPFFFV